MNHLRAGTSLRFRVLGGSGLLATLLSAGVAAKVETWRHEGASAFAKGRREGVVISDTGRVRLSQAVRPSRKLDAARVWDLARTPQGVLFAASGNEGKVFRSTDGDWSVAFDSGDSQAFSLAAMPDGRVYAGTGPGGSVVEVTSPDHPAERPDPKVQYVWDLASDPKGNLYAATGPTGQLWRRAPDGAWSLLLDSKHPHLLSVAVGPDGVVYAGSDGEGLIYRVGPDGKATVLHDAPQNEVRALLVAPDGALYAGTAADAGRGSDSAEPSSMAPFRLQAPGGATPRPPTPGENSVYRIGPEGVPREVFRHKAMIYALAWRDDRLYVGTGPEGQLFEVRDGGRESSPIARVDHGQVLSLLAEPKDGLLMGAGDPGAVLRLDPGHVAGGTLTSEVLDAKLISRFGALGWKAERPAGTSVSVKVRTGNVGEPDATWSPWSAEQSDPSSAAAKVPPGRFAQYQVSLATTDPAATPEVRAISLRYQTANLPPEIAKVDVPDVSAGDGATRQSRMPLRWEATDPNGDDLAYTLQIRKEGWPDWVQLGADALTEATYAWDTSAVPDGTYRLRVVASDRPSNPPADAQTRDRISDPFLIDHQAPAVAVALSRDGVLVSIKDGSTRIAKAAYALDGGDWMPIFPDDGLFDSPSEKITVALPDLKPGTHVLMVRATDAAGNLGTGDLVIPGR